MFSLSSRLLQVRVRYSVCTIYLYPHHNISFAVFKIESVTFYTVHNASSVTLLVRGSLYSLKKK